jgi:hypothetical protein
MSYLLRLWRASDDPIFSGRGVELWRASLERVQDGERLSFATLDELVDFLRQETVSGSCPQGGKEGKRG